MVPLAPRRTPWRLSPWLADVPAAGPRQPPAQQQQATSAPPTLPQPPSAQMQQLEQKVNELTRKMNEAAQERDKEIRAVRGIAEKAAEDSTKKVEGLAKDLKKLQVSVTQNAEMTEGMLRMNFDSMKDSLLTSMAHMMRGMAAGAGDPSREAQGSHPPLCPDQSRRVSSEGSGHDLLHPPASSEDSGYVGGGLKVARVSGSESVTEGLVTTPAPPTFGGTSKATADEDGDLNMGH